MATPEQQRRAARLARLPGLTLAAVRARTGLSASELKRARAAFAEERFPGREDLLISALTRAGQDREGALGDPRGLASYLDYLNHDGTGADEVLAMIAALADRGVLAVEDGRYRLLVPWP